MAIQLVGQASIIGASHSNSLPPKTSQNTSVVDPAAKSVGVLPTASLVLTQQQQGSAVTHMPLEESLFPEPLSPKQAQTEKQVPEPNENGFSYARAAKGAGLGFLGSTIVTPVAILPVLAPLASAGDTAFKSVIGVNILSNTAVAALVYGKRLSEKDGAKQGLKMGFVMGVSAGALAGVAAKDWRLGLGAVGLLAALNTATGYYVGKKAGN